MDRVGLMVLFWILACSSPFAQPAPEPGGLELVEIGADARGEPRSYWIHVPPDVDSRLPVLFAFHGGRGSNGKAAMAKHWRSTFGRDVILVFPNGQLRDPKTGGWDGDQVEVVRAMVDDVRKRFPVDPTHVYAVGFSSGGHIVNLLACRTPDLFAGFGRTGRTLLASTRDACPAPADVPQIMILGTEDQSARDEGKRDPKTGAIHELPAADAWAFWLDRAGCPPTPSRVETLPDRGDRCEVEVRTYAGCRDVAAMQYVHAAGAKHEWSHGGDRDSTCRDLDTTEAFLKFFETYAGLERG
jgi:polyhydroxybutyrate depolymerase